MSTDTILAALPYEISGERMRHLIATTLLVLGGAVPGGVGTAAAETRSITTDIWVDNWFAMSVNGTAVLEDSVPITTERSFNAESATFDADLPMTIAIMAKDFKENDTGLEYIGTDRQQRGDGGMIAQFRDADTGEIVAVTNEDMRCLVVHRAPLDDACVSERAPVAGQGACTFEEVAIPTDWTDPGFDDGAWTAAVEHTVRDVSPKDGYDEVDWNRSARLIWSEDLVRDNTLLCRVTIGEAG